LRGSPFKGVRPYEAAKVAGLTEPKMLTNRRIAILISNLAAVTLGAIPFQIYQAQPVYSSNHAILTPVESISYQFHNHIHGLGYDSQNQRLLIATHYGIFVWKDGQLFQLGETRDDFMGFSLHPTNSKIIYTSGHPKSGGNMGVMKSEDGGASFKPIFRGLGAETVDFHSMTITPANPKILYGWFQEKLYRSKDGGKSWQFASARGIPQQGFCFGAPCLSADSQKKGTVYAGTPRGLFVAYDFGENWTPVNLELGAVAGVGVHPSNALRLFAFTQNLGMASSQDRGKNWQPRSSGIQLSREDFIFAFAFDRKNSEQIFAATPEKVFQSTDGGKNWERII